MNGILYEEDYIGLFVLVTLLLNKGDAGEGGGRDQGRQDDRRPPLA